jgi:hypothetical protein
MKTTTPDSMKFRRLQRKLGVSKCHTVGILELLWIATAKNTPLGDIGKFSNEEIAIECDWEGDPDELVTALLECRWLDAHDQYRLVIHDWADHCPNHIKANVERWDKKFAVPPKEHPKDTPRDTPREHPKEHPQGIVPPSLAYPNLSKPNPSSPSPTNPGPANPDGKPWSEVWGAVGVGDEFFERVRDEANRFARLKRPIDRDLVWQACWVAVQFDRDCVAEVCEKVRQGDVRSPTSYLNAAMRKLCERNGEDWNRLKKLVPETPPLRPFQQEALA